MPPVRSSGRRGTGEGTAKVKVEVDVAASKKKDGDVVMGDDSVFALPPTTKTIGPWGSVRATPFGSCLKMYQKGRSADEWNEWRARNIPPLRVPQEGFGHVYGQATLDRVDGTDLGDDPAAGDLMNDDEMKNDEFYSSTTTMTALENCLKHPHDFGSTKTPDDAPVASLLDKWRLLPHFLSLRSLMRQHIDSFDHFINVEINKIVQSPSAREIRSDHDAKWFLR